MIYLEVPKSLKPIVNQAHQVAKYLFRPISRKYDRAEHEYPKELDMLAALMDGLKAGSGQRGAGVDALQRDEQHEGGVRNGANMSTCLGLTELCWGDIGLALSIPRQGLGNAAIIAVADSEQKERFDGVWAAMAITEPGAGSDSANIRTTARLDGDEWVLNGEKIYVTAGSRADSVVVWATLDRNLGRAAIKSFIVPHGTPGMEVVRLDKKMGIRASDTASITLTDCRIPKANLHGNPEIDTKKGFGGVMQTFDNTRPVVAGLAVGVARAALEHTRTLLAKEGIEVRYRGSLFRKSAAEAELIRMEADWEAGRLLMLKAAWMADNGIPNSMEASMSKAKAARVANRVTLRCVELCGGLGYSEDELLEKWARDSKILDIFEGTQQIQLLIIARRLLGKRSSELR
ncbi:MAG: acyl-CoA dehydrogenase family protein [Polyangiales bacterium]